MCLRGVDDMADREGAWASARATAVGCSLNFLAAF